MEGVDCKVQIDFHCGISLSIICDSKSPHSVVVNEWIIVYDGKKITENPNLFGKEGNPKIKECVFIGEGISGNPQRNYALTQMKEGETILYYLDDDNIIHPDLYQLLNVIDSGKMYTFNQFNRIKGDNVSIQNIDTAMCLIDSRLCKNIEWIPEKYDADGYYIEECYRRNQSVHVFVDNDLCYYNMIQSP